MRFGTPVCAVGCVSAILALTSEATCGVESGDGVALAAAFWIIGL